MGIVGTNRLEATVKEFGTFRMAINAAASLSSRELFWWVTDRGQVFSSM